MKTSFLLKSELLSLKKKYLLIPLIIITIQITSMGQNTPNLTCRTWNASNSNDPSDFANSENEITIDEAKALKSEYQKRWGQGDETKFVTWNTFDFLKILSDQKLIPKGNDKDFFIDRECKLLRIHVGHYNQNNNTIANLFQRREMSTMKIDSIKGKNTLIFEIICIKAESCNKPKDKLMPEDIQGRSFFNLGDLCPHLCNLQLNVDEN